MTRRMLALGFAAVLSASASYGFDMPHGIDFQLGFDIRFVPGPHDTSQALGLGVAMDKFYSDKTQSLSMTGTITNYSNVPCYGIEMHVDVTSYLGLGASKGRAVVEPDSLSPGGTATFKLFLSLDSPQPKDALYTITAYTPSPYAQESSPGATVPVASDAVRESTGR